MDVDPIPASTAPSAAAGAGSSRSVKIHPIPGLIATALASAAFLLSILSVPWCDYATLSSTIYDPAGAPLVETRLGFGLWRHQLFDVADGGLRIENSCTSYDEGLVVVDPAWAAARAFGCLAPIIGGLNLVYSYWNCWRVYSNDAKAAVVGEMQMRISGAIFIVAAFYQGLTLLFLRSSVCKSEGAPEFREWLGSNVEPATIVYDETCTLSTGANLTIGSVLCWFVAGVFLCMVHSPTRQRSVRDDNASAADNEPMDMEQGEDNPNAEGGSEAVSSVASDEEESSISEEPMDKEQQEGHTQQAEPEDPATVQTDQPDESPKQKKTRKTWMKPQTRRRRYRP